MTEESAGALAVTVLVTVADVTVVVIVDALCLRPYCRKVSSMFRKTDLKNVRHCWVQ